jgi:DNA-binding transcriptional ArsR family regulator
MALAAAADALAAPLQALAVDPRRLASPGDALAALGRFGPAPAVLVDAAHCAEWLDRLGGALAPARPRTLVVVGAPAAPARLALARGADEVIAADADADELSLALFGRRSGVGESGAAAQPTLADLSSEVKRIALALDGLARGEAARPADLPAPDAAFDAGRVRAIIRARRARAQFFPGDLFADPAWDILLDLTAARIEGKPVSVSSLCIAAAVPATTALRWIRTLTDAGLLEREADPHDGRRVYVALSDGAAQAMQAYLAQAARAGAPA